MVADDSRARKLAAVTQGMPRDEIEHLIGVTAPPAVREEPHEEILRMIGKRKREVIERECFGLIEFVDAAHDFSVVGGIVEVKKELTMIAKNIRGGRTARGSMGLMFAGPKGSRKCFVSEGVVKED